MRARLAISLAACFLVVVCAATPVRADDASDAKVHYQKATAHYAVGEYKEAAGEYEAAYKAKQDPALLYNAAQSHRLAGDNQKALLLYRNIVKLHPTSKYAIESKDRIDKLEQAIATTQSPPNQPAPVDGNAPAASAPVQPLVPATTPGAPPAAAPPPAVPPAPPPGASPAATLTTAPPSNGEAPVYTKGWFWAVIGAVVVGGVVTAVVLSGGSSGAWSNVPDVKGAVR
jgi:tetratricopeptide (TPR) repeat protein